MVEERKAAAMPDFTVQPADVLNTRIENVIGEKFVKKCGQTEREREETSMTETATIEDLAGTKYVGLFFSADWCPPCK